MSKIFLVVLNYILRYLCLRLVGLCGLRVELLCVCYPDNVQCIAIVNLWDLIKVFPYDLGSCSFMGKTGHNDRASAK